MAKAKKPQTVPLNEDERRALERYLALMEDFEQWYMLLQKRAGDVGVREQYDKIRPTLLTTAQKIFRTVPSEQREYISTAADNTRVMLLVPPKYINGVAIGYPTRNERYVCVPAGPLNQILSNFMDQNCVFCTGEPEVREICKYRKAIEALFVTKIDGVDADGHCQFSGLV